MWVNVKLLQDVLPKMRPSVHHGEGGILYLGENGAALDGFFLFNPDGDSNFLQVHVQNCLLHHETNVISTAANTSKIFLELVFFSIL